MTQFLCCIPLSAVEQVLAWLKPHLPPQQHAALLTEVLYPAPIRIAFQSWRLVRLSWLSQYVLLLKAAVHSQVQQVVPDELLLQLLVSWLAPTHPPLRSGGAAPDGQRAQLPPPQDAVKVNAEPRLSEGPAVAVEATALVGDSDRNRTAGTQPRLLLPPVNAGIGCLPRCPEATESLQGDGGCVAAHDDADDAPHPSNGEAEQPASAPTQPLRICCRRALSLPLSRDGHECGGGSPSSGRAPLQVRTESVAFLPLHLLKPVQSNALELVT